MSRSLDDVTNPDSKSESSERSKIYALYQARLRAEEIDFLAREQYNADLNKLIDASVAKLSNDYEFERTEIDRRAKIQFSVTKNEQRISILTAQQEILEKALNETREKLRQFRETPEYGAVLGNVIKQSIEVLNEKETIIYVVARDIALAEQAIAGALEGRSGTARVDHDSPLPEKLIGGAIVSNVDGTIRVDNSFEGRLLLAAEGSLPQIGALMKSKGHH